MKEGALLATKQLALYPDFCVNPFFIYINTVLRIFSGIQRYFEDI